MTDLDDPTFESYQLVNKYGKFSVYATGVFTFWSFNRIKSITDGLSKTYCFGEKWVPPSGYDSASSGGDDAVMTKAWIAITFAGQEGHKNSASRPSGSQDEAAHAGRITANGSRVRRPIWWTSRRRGPDGDVRWVGTRDQF